MAFNSALVAGVMSGVSKLAGVVNAQRKQLNSVSPTTVGGSSARGVYDELRDVAQSNNKWSADQAEALRDWQEQQNKIAMDFNAAEAAKNRDWQEMMSNTAYQRQVRDLKAAGLNPILAATNGNGAAVTSGATASGVTSSGAMGQTDMSLTSALVSMLGNLLQRQTQLQVANTNALTNLTVADKYNAMSKYTADLSAQVSRENAKLASDTSRSNAKLQSDTEILRQKMQNDTTLTAANISATTQRYVAELQANTSLSVAQINAAATKISAEIHASAQRYGYNVSRWTQTDIAKLNARVNKELKQMDIDSKFDFAEAYPSSAFGMFDSVIGQITGGEGLSGLSDFPLSGVSAAKALFDRFK